MCDFKVYGIDGCIVEPTIRVGWDLSLPKAQYSAWKHMRWKIFATEGWSFQLQIYLLQNRTCAVNAIVFRFWILGFGFWILDSGFWILDSGFWILDSGFWILLNPVAMQNHP
ncbi:hypothetical protein BV898_10582 [Hypsibius exemplaris]|uniref:Uncharacterized protein n=1 Tax=Hypsibius exemplaris TaxID=2072580 RepID=A0A1W0WJ02_HYPEX|nr:hypothetical protein BV898_10582 [Hypsibius exemplaris]